MGKYGQMILLRQECDSSGDSVTYEPYSYEESENPPMTPLRVMRNDCLVESWPSGRGRAVFKVSIQSRTMYSRRRSSAQMHQAPARHAEPQRSAWYQCWLPKYATGALPRFTRDVPTFFCVVAQAESSIIRSFRQEKPLFPQSCYNKGCLRRQAFDNDTDQNNNPRIT